MAVSSSQAEERKNDVIKRLFPRARHFQFPSISLRGPRLLIRERTRSGEKNGRGDGDLVEMQPRNPLTVHVHARSDIGAWNGCRERCVSPRWNGIGSNPRARLGTARASRAAVAVRSVRLSREVHLGTLTGATPPPLHFAPLHSTSTRLCARSVHGSKLARSAHNDSPRSPLLPSLPRPFSGFSPLLPLITIAILKLLLLLLLRDVSRGIGEVKSELYPSVSSHRSKFDFEYVSVVYVV